MRGNRDAPRRSHDRSERPDGGRLDRCPHCERAVLGITLTAAHGPRSWPCGHRLTIRHADRLSGAGPAVARLGDAEG